MTNRRTIVSAINPERWDGHFEVQLKVWFEELDGPIPFVATPLDCEAHGRELWIRAMAGEYGPVELKMPKMLEPQK